MKKSSKIFAGLLIGGVIASSGLLVGCGENPNDTTTTEPLSSTSEVYGFAGATTGMLMNNKTLQSAMVASMEMGANDTSSTFDDLKKSLDAAITGTLDKYMDLFDSVVGGKTPVDVVDGTSDKEEYKHKLTITVNSIDGNTTTCTLYFNETFSKDGSEVEDSDDTEEETVLEGELYLNDSKTPLYVSGKKEKDKDEMEVSFEVSLKKGDETHKVVFNQEREVGDDGEVEEEYVFQIVMGDYKQEFSFEMERDLSGNIEVEYSQTIGDVEVSFEIEKTSDNSITIETKSFLGVELKINVKVEKSEDGTQERYVYTLEKLGSYPLTEAVVFNGNWR